jgi:hypothetical protein
MQTKVLLVLKTAGLGILALVATGGVALAASVDLSGVGAVLLKVGVPLVAAVLNLVLFLLSYRILLRDPPPWGTLLPGATFAAVGWVALQIGGAWYASGLVGRATAVYGTFAAAVGVLLLLYLAARLFVYGAELNVTLVRGGGDMERASPAGGANGAATDRSTGELVRSIGSDTVTLVRKEVELAKLEVKEGIAARVKGAAVLGSAAVMALYMVGFLAAAGAAALALVVELWAALLIVAGVFLLLTLIGALAGGAMLKGPPIAPERAKQNLKEDVEWARTQLRR